MRIEHALQADDLVAQGEPPFLQTPQQQFVPRNGLDESVDGGVQVGVLDPQFDQLTGKGVEIGVQ